MQLSLHTPLLQVWLAPQLPQLAPQPSSPHALFLQSGTQLSLHAPLLQLWLAPQVPQLPPQPSSPHRLPPQAGAHIAASTEPHTSGAIWALAFDTQRYPTPAEQTVWPQVRSMAPTSMWHL